jgi:hypothetical protein
MLMDFSAPFMVIFSVVEVKDLFLGDWNFQSVIEVSGKLMKHLWKFQRDNYLSRKPRNPSPPSPAVSTIQ